MFYLNTIVQLFLYVEQLYQLEVCLPYSRLLTGIPILVVFQNLGWNSNKTSLILFLNLKDMFCKKLLNYPGLELTFTEQALKPVRQCLNILHDFYKVWNFRNFFYHVDDKLLSRKQFISVIVYHVTC